MGNTTITINGSDYDLIHDQVYHLTVEANNDAGSTPSEEILLCKSSVLLPYYFNCVQWRMLDMMYSAVQFCVVIT